MRGDVMLSAEIREADLYDIPALVELLGELFAQERDFMPDRDKQARGLALIINHPERGRIFTARLNETVIGMANALFTVSTVEGGPVILLEDVMVAGPYRGQGIGRQLFDHVLHWARANGFLRVTLLTDGDNAGALRFYERHGFVRSQMTVLRRAM